MVLPLGPFRRGTPSNAGTQWGEDVLSRRYTVNLGGPIIKDKLWFAFSTKQDPSILTPQSFNSVQGLNVLDPTAPANTAGYASGAGQPSSAAMNINKTSLAFVESR